MKYIDLRIIGVSDADIQDFVALCMAIQESGDKGEGRTIAVVVDGDGSGKLSFNVNGQRLPSARAENDKIYIGE